MLASLRRIIEIVRKEIIQIRRDRRMFGLVLMMPVLELFIFGYVVANDVDNIDLAVCDFSRTPESRSLVEQLERSGYFRVRAPCARLDDADGLLDRGVVKVVLAIPPDFAMRLKRGETAPVMAAIDGSNSNTATIASSYLQQVTWTQAVDVLMPDGRAARLAPPAPVEAEPRMWFNPELRMLRFMVPGIICILLMESLVIMTAMAIVKEKERGTIEQILVSPIKRFEYIIGKALPFVGLGYVNVTLVILVGTYWFDVAIAGSIPLLFALTGLFIFTCLGMGLMASALSDTQQQASMTGQFIILPNMFFSGFMFPIASMPEVVQKFTYAIPLRYYITIVRGIFLKGVGWTELKDEAGILVGFSIVILGLATTFFRKQIR
ncbi:ABC transporter permease [Candidatus Binatia bacterium]|nr:ABC transporter permease [Candidatus Binatia bacterium]